LLDSPRGRKPDSALGSFIRHAPLLYLVSVGLAFVCTACAEVMYAAVALMWLVPDRCIEAAIKQGRTAELARVSTLCVALC
jgi:hypothetical protein